MEVVEFTEINPSSYAAAYGSTDYSDSSDEGEKMDANEQVHTALRVYSSILNSQDSLAEIFFLLEKKVGDTVEHGISRTVQNLVNSDFPDADTVLLPPSLSTIDAKPNKSKKAAPKSIEKVYINQIILNDKMNNIRDIFVYEIPVGWSHAKIIAELKAWGDVISMMIKRQRKYQMLRIKICLSTFSLASFDQSIWQYFLDDQAV
ncbi:hypothetical protein GLOIN_2v1765605 [Rhizophagus clarus]|uniref:Uncharacterized protein n=1 Tax=Rhizophagus clarus TaxID=94130 RepID=A0A8H3QR40_9GLOM|nr:hypothetical protein GLOIN_2v1765605 [Rhizophagus clarus]